VFVETATKAVVNVAEVAHIVAASGGGARGQDDVSDEERSAWANLILLCANCHTLVDKTERDYPVELLIKWKSDHIQRIDEAFGVRRFRSRVEVYSKLAQYRTQNRAIYETYGPMSHGRFDPESESPRLWRAHVRESILPNNRAMLRIMDHNKPLMTAPEVAVVEQFRIHVLDFERRHLQDEPRGSGLQFPPAVDSLFGDVHDV